MKHSGFVLVDTDGDGATDTYLPGTSNFAAGWASPREKAASGAGAIPALPPGWGHPPALHLSCR